MEDSKMHEERQYRCISRGWHNCKAPKDGTCDTEIPKEKSDLAEA